MSETEKYVVIDHDNDNRKAYDDHADAQDAAETARSFGSEDVEIVMPATPETDGGAPPAPASLSTNPIEYLEGINSAFVNTIQGTPAISKQGFRFIQREFQITTECEVVKWVDDPVGVVVWARASLPNGHAAEAHGEGYLDESGVDDNEFVRYADTRAKNRALSDLTSAGALAVAELGDGVEQ